MMNHPRQVIVYIQINTIAMQSLDNKDECDYKMKIAMKDKVDIVCEQ
jgi:hypothetical protein